MLTRISIISLFSALFVLASGASHAFSIGEHYVCAFDKILRFYENREPYFTGSHSNQSPFSFVVQTDKIKMGENWFVGSSIPTNYISETSLTAFDGRDLVKLTKKDGRVSGFAGTLDSYIKAFYVTCRQLQSRSLELNYKIKSNILKDFDKKLQTELSTDLYSFIATVKLDEGDSFHDVVDVIFNRDGAKGLKEFLNGLVVMLEGFQEENSQGKT